MLRGLGERYPSASYAYLREVCQRMEAITWEEAEATMALYGSLEGCVQKLWDAAVGGDGSGDLLVYPGRSGAAPAGPGQYAAFRRGGDARGTWALTRAPHPDPLPHGADGVNE